MSRLHSNSTGRRRSFRMIARAVSALTFLCIAVLGLACWDLHRYRELARREQVLRASVLRLGGRLQTGPRGPKWLQLLPAQIRPEAPTFVISIDDLPFSSYESTYPQTVVDLLGGFRHLEQVSFYEVDDSISYSSQPRERPSRRLYYVDFGKLHLEYPQVTIVGIKM